MEKPMTKRRTNLFIDGELWRRLRVRAAEESTTATALLSQAVAEFLERKPSTAKRGKR
jgi:hypothetical protein